MSGDSVADPVFERFLRPDERAQATEELVERGAEAVPILEALFDGTAKNLFGVPYRKLGTPLDCGLVAAGRLGTLGKPLEGHLREALRSGHVYAAEALGHLGTLAEESIAELAAQLAGENILLAGESAHALVHCGQASHPVVQEAIQSSVRGRWLLERAIHFLAAQSHSQDD